LLGKNYDNAFYFSKVIRQNIVYERSALSDPYCQFVCSSVNFCGYVCHIFYPEVVRDNVVSNDVTITSTLQNLKQILFFS